MVRKMINIGDEVLVYINTPKDTFNIWYKVKPYGEGVAQGRSFWHRESHVRRVNRFDDLDSIGD